MEKPIGLRGLRLDARWQGRAHARLCTAGILCVALAVALGCTAEPSTTAVQAGDSVSLAFVAEDGGVGTSGGSWLSPLDRIGYGSKYYSDPQRGELFIRATGTGATAGQVKDFETAFTIPSGPLKRSSHGMHGFGESIVILADVPSDTVPGDYTLELLHRAPDGQVNPALLTYGYGRSITILPSDLPFDCGPGLTQACNSIGSPTKIAQFGNSWVNWRANGGLAPAPRNYMSLVAIPDPGFELKVEVVDDPDELTTGNPVGAAQLSITYPAASVTITSVVPDRPSRNAYWFEPGGPANEIIVHGASLVDSEPLGSVWVNFELLEGATPVLETDFGIELLEATDQLGAQYVDAQNNPTVELGWVQSGIR